MELSIPYHELYQENSICKLPKSTWSRKIQDITANFLVDNKLWHSLETSQINWGTFSYNWKSIARMLKIVARMHPCHTFIEHICIRHHLFSKCLSCGYRNTGKFTRRTSSSSYKSSIRLRNINPSDESHKTHPQLHYDASTLRKLFVQKFQGGLLLQNLKFFDANSIFNLTMYSPREEAKASFINNYNPST